MKIFSFLSGLLFGKTDDTESFPVKENTSLLNKVSKNLDTVQYLYDNVKIKLQSTIDSNSSLEKKIILFLGYLITFTTYLITTKEFEGYYIVIISYILLTVSCSILLIPKSFFYKGNNPSKLLLSKNKKFIGQDLGKIILSEVVLYEQRINHNEEVNSRMGSYFLVLLILNSFVLILYLILENY